MDLSCSESKADISEDLGTPSTQTSQENAFLMEYHLLGRAEARVELERLLSVEEQTKPPADYLNTSCITPLEREWLVDTMCVAGERLNFSFVTKSLAINILDRFWAASAQVHSGLSMLVAVASMSIAAKLEDGCFPLSQANMLCAMFWGVPGSSADLGRMELAILSNLSWRGLGVTAANLLDPLICSLDLDDPALDSTGGLGQLLMLREGCKLVLAKTLRDEHYLQYRPSSLATAAILLMLESMSTPWISLMPTARPLELMFSSQHRVEIQTCQQRMRCLVGNDHLGLDLKYWRVEVAEDRRVVRMSRQNTGSTTPTSVLLSVADRLDSPPATFLLDMADSAYADLQMGSMNGADDVHLGLSDFD